MIVKTQQPLIWRVVFPQFDSHTHTQRLQKIYLHLFDETATMTLKAAELPSMAEDIPLFGLKEESEEGGGGSRGGDQGRYRRIESAEKGIETAEKGEIESRVSFGTDGCGGCSRSR